MEHGAFIYRWFSISNWQVTRGYLDLSDFLAGSFQRLPSHCQDGLADLLLKITGKYDVGWFNVAESSILVGETDITNLHFAWSNMVTPAFWLLNPSGSCFSEPPKLSNYLSSSVRTGFPASCWASLCKIKGWQGAWACGSSSCFSTGLSEHGHTKKDTLLKLSAPANISFW